VKFVLILTFNGVQSLKEGENQQVLVVVVLSCFCGSDCCGMAIVYGIN
jgi:hypothetical protein